MDFACLFGWYTINCAHTQIDLSTKWQVRENKQTEKTESFRFFYLKSELSIISVRAPSFLFLFAGFVSILFSFKAKKEKAKQNQGHSVELFAVISKTVLCDAFIDHFLNSLFFYYLFSFCRFPSSASGRSNKPAKVNSHLFNS